MADRQREIQRLENWNATEKLKTANSVYISIKRYLTDITDQGIAAILGNMDIESDIFPASCEKGSGKFKACVAYCKDLYNGTLTKSNFVNHTYPSTGASYAKFGAGFGLVQLSTSASKSALYDETIGKNPKEDLWNVDIQCKCLVTQLRNYYSSVTKILCSKTATLEQCTRTFWINYEKPKNQSESAFLKRLAAAQAWYGTVLKSWGHYVYKPRVDIDDLIPTNSKFNPDTAKYYLKSGYNIDYKGKVTKGLNKAILGRRSREINIPAVGSVLPNCVGYAWGRMYELTGAAPAFSPVMAGSFADYARNAGYDVSMVPRVGDVCCWSKGWTTSGKQKTGHVAVVEDVDDNMNIYISQSSYGGATMSLQELKNRLFIVKYPNQTGTRRLQKINAAIKEGKRYFYGKKYTLEGFIHLDIGLGGGNYSDFIERNNQIQVEDAVEDEVGKLKIKLSINSYYNSIESAKVYIKWNTYSVTDTNYDVVKEIKIENKDIETIEISVKLPQNAKSVSIICKSFLSDGSSELGNVFIEAIERLYSVVSIYDGKRFRNAVPYIFHNNKWTLAYARMYSGERWRNVLRSRKSTVVLEKDLEDYGPDA